MEGAFNLQVEEIAFAFPPAIQEILLTSQENWLTAEEMLVLFQNRHIFPLSVFTVPEPGLYLLHSSRFRDDHGWTNFPNGRRTRSERLPGQVPFNVSYSQSPNLERKTIRNRNLFIIGGNTFVHYI